jgi:hypothetical protein
MLGLACDPKDGKATGFSIRGPGLTPEQCWRLDRAYRGEGVVGDAGVFHALDQTSIAPNSYIVCSVVDHCKKGSARSTG